MRTITGIRSHPMAADRYLGLKDGKLAAVSDKTRWIFTRYGRYFALREEKSQKGIAFVSGKGIPEMEICPYQCRYRTGSLPKRR
ncbi:MAG: hypothetical protein ACLR6B_09805 [Blautia sp.]